MAKLGGEDEFNFSAKVCEVSAGFSDDHDVRGKLDRAATRLIENVAEVLPQDLLDLIREDTHRIGSAVFKMISEKKCQYRMVAKLEAFGLHMCSKWHKDSYIGRALTAYCGSGTEYTPTDNIDWTDKCCLPVLDKDKIRTCSAGDILLIKGSLFPSSGHSLIHKSPATAYRADGSILHRLLLKIDLYPADRITDSSRL